MEIAGHLKCERSEFVNTVIDGEELCNLIAMTDYAQEQEMEIEALQAILMEDIEEIDPSESGLNTKNRCFQIRLYPQEDDVDESTCVPVELALIFAHSEKYPDELPHLYVRSIRGIGVEDLRSLQDKLEQEASENLGIVMVFTLVTSAKEWLAGKFGQQTSVEDPSEDDMEKDDVIVPHGEPVTSETFLTWRERFEAELALEKAKLLPESALFAPKEKRLTGRQWYESGRAVNRGTGAVTEEAEEDEDDIDLDEDFEDDEEDMLEHYLTER